MGKSLSSKFDSLLEDFCELQDDLHTMRALLKECKKKICDEELRKDINWFLNKEKGGIK